MGEVASALETFSQAVASLHAAGNLVDELSSTVVLADLWMAAGRPSKARRLCERALQLAEAQGEGFARAITDLHVGLSEIDVEVGELESAKRHLEAAAALADRARMSENRYRWFVAMGRVAQAAAQPAEAVRLLDQAEQLYRPGFFPDVRPIASMKARIWIAQGKLSEAADWARDRGVSVTDTASYLSEFDHLTLVRLLLARQRADPDIVAADQAGDLLERLRSAAETSGRGGSLLEIGMLQALTSDLQGHRPEATESLARALAHAPEPEGYVRLFLDEGAPMISLLRDAAHHGDAGDADYQRVASDRARRLLSVGAAPAVGPPDAGPRQAPSADSLSDRELQVLRLLDSELSGPQIARELFVSNNTLSTHTKHIFTKLGVSSRRGAVLRARERGLI
jgi:LuxR family maltose regulon positive regulatory protein